MTERQARIDAISAVIDRWFGGVGDDYTQAANDILVAVDAVGRERVSEANVEAFKDALTALLDAWSIRSTEGGDARLGKAYNGVVGMYREAIGVPRPMDALLTAAPAERGDLDMLTAEVGAWGERTFPSADNDSITSHLLEEADELTNAAHIAPDGIGNIEEEAADCLLLLMHLAHRNGFSLLDEARKKFAMNQTRTWTTVTAGGYVKHDEVKP